MPPEITTFLLAMTPIGELRVSLPIALTVYNLNPVFAYLISVVGNLIPVVLLLFFLEPVSNWLSREFKIFQKVFFWLFQRTRDRYNGKMKKYGYPALTFFVAIPLPLTGGWTGALIAFLFDLPLKKAIPLITLGVMIAGGIVLAVTQAGMSIEKYFGWQVLLGLLLGISFSWLLYRQRKNSKLKTNKPID